jgi:hypothetical protein
VRFILLFLAEGASRRPRRHAIKQGSEMDHRTGWIYFGLAWWIGARHSDDRPSRGAKRPPPFHDGLPTRRCDGLMEHRPVSRSGGRRSAGMLLQVKAAVRVRRLAHIDWEPGPPRLSFRDWITHARQRHFDHIPGMKGAGGRCADSGRTHIPTKCKSLDRVDIIQLAGLVSRANISISRG